MRSLLNRAIFITKDVEMNQTSILRVSYTTTGYFSVNFNLLDNFFHSLNKSLISISVSLSYRSKFVLHAVGIVICRGI